MRAEGASLFKRPLPILAKVWRAWPNASIYSYSLDITAEVFRSTAPFVFAFLLSSGYCSRLCLRQGLTGCKPIQTCQKQSIWLPYRSLLRFRPSWEHYPCIQTRLERRSLFLRRCIRFQYQGCEIHYVVSWLYGWKHVKEGETDRVCPM